MGATDIFGKFLKREPEEGTNYLSLTLTSDKVLATIWRLDNSNVNVVGSSEKDFHTIDSLIREAAVAIDSAAKNITTDVSQVVFGLSNYWFEAGSVSKETGEILKNLAEELELDAQAFVPLSASINHYFKLSDGTKNLLAVGTFKDYTEISYINDGKVETKELKGKASKSDIERLIENFQIPKDIFLQKVIIFGSNSEHLRHDFIKDEKAELFKKDTKIELLSNEDLAKCVAYSQAADVLGREPELAAAAASSVPEVINDKKEETVEEPKEIEQKDEKAQDSDFEFKEGEDVLNESVEANALINTEEVEKGSKIDEKKEDKTPPDEYAVNVEEVEHGYESPKQKLNEASEHHKKSALNALLTMNWLSPLIKGNNKKKLVLPAVILTLLLIGGAFIFSYTLSSVEVLIKANSKPLENDFDVTVASGAALDTTRSRIPGEETSVTVSESSQAQTTGTKKTGNSAKGEVKVLNWTTSKVNFEKGTVIISKSGVKFKIDSAIEIASRSAASPGETNAAVTAEDFGTNGNVASGTEFTFQKHDELLYSAKNDNAFTGGDEKQITVVAKADQDKLLNSLQETLTEKAKSELQAKLSGQTIEEDAIEIKIKNKQFSANIDEEASSLTLNMEVEASALSYSQDTLKELLSKMAQEESDGNLESKPENLDILDINVQTSKGTLNLEGRYRANLVTKIDEENIKTQIAGKSQKSAREIIKQNSEVTDVVFKFSPNFVLISSIPKNKDKISLKVEAIK